MKAKILSLTIVGLLATFASVNAQEATTVNPGRKTVFQKDSFKDHWFVDVQVGAGIQPFGEANNQADFMKRLSILPNLAVGRWHNPYFGTRAHFYLWNVYGFEKNATKTVDRYANNFGAAQLEFMFDVFNYFMPYNPDRIFRIVPFVGVGAAARFNTKDANGNTINFPYANKGIDYSGAFNAGLIFKFHVADAWDINLESQLLLDKNNFAGTNRYSNSADYLHFLSLGLSYNFAKREFKEVVPMDEEAIREANNQISALREENRELSKRPVSCPECPEVSAFATGKTDGKKISVIDNIVYFRLDSYKIDQNQIINIYNTAKYAKNNNSKIYVVGYADVKTGTPSYNMTLSQKRAEAVANMLINEYGIEASRVIIDYKGDTVQPFDVNEWNRVVIMTAEN